MLFGNSLQIQEIMIPVSQLPQEGGKIHTTWPKFCLLQEIHVIFHYS